ncbi:hypothetical protein A3D71_00720 [Candidatus Kaiserbacteria bacterium RIFCSPHIGHO2_02_FULL_55_20]|uniref:Phosphoribosyltransferase domain-containing protein n=1 Tax=Candidatus Kaiserbacteria bacterium RIFCSPHIGHO2_02_FULL_55_20 TaxID=1798497 RepID=A0A1F6DX04_9BACT|nr:MAG: hypothetical protein A2680_00710 [Candidatus Kaiserbacteria bacterium RIFCSPHIGHO2_01_FULL_55_37]OGG65877.1 MAG: hypothetical protein A3D71_00720 [Candidatus Kaiserbacteria bacterium RIFCSPHIGHO2_02_FULL_55_20]
MIESALEGKPNKLIYLDQVRGALSEFRGLVLPNVAVERAIRDTLDNLSATYPDFEIIHKDSIALASEVTKNIGLRGSIFMDYHSYKEEVEKLGSPIFSVARARFNPINSTFGPTPIVGKGSPMDVQRDQLAKQFANKEVVLLDDMLTSGWTFARAIPYLTDAGIKVCAIGVVVTNKPEDTFVVPDKSLPVFAGYQVNPATDIEAFELKNFLAIPGSGAALFQGASTHRAQIEHVRESLQRYLETNRDDTHLRRELYTLQLDFDEGELLHKVSQIVSPEIKTEELLDVLHAFNLDNFHPDLVGTTRSLYIGDYHTSAWRMTDEVWKEFSRLQMETSIRLYEDIRDMNVGSITVGQLGIFDEVALDKSTSVEKYLAGRLKLLEAERT